METKLEYSTLIVPTNGPKQIDASYELLESIRRTQWDQITNIRKSTVYAESRQKETNLERHNKRLEELKKLDEEIPLKQQEIEQRVMELMENEQAENLQQEFENFKLDCEKILDQKRNLIKEFQKELDQKHNMYIYSIQKFKVDITLMINLMRKQFISIRDKMLENIWNEKFSEDNMNIEGRQQKKKLSINELQEKNRFCIEGEFLRDRDILLKEYHELILNLIKKLESSEELSGILLSQQENEREIENEKEAFKEESKFINRIIVMERFFNILKEQIEDFTYELKILLEILEYRVEIREEKIKENKEKAKKYEKDKNKMKVKISKSQKAYRMIDNKLRSENMALKIDFIKMTDSFDDLKKKFKHFKSFDEERFMQIYNMNFIESRELAKKVLYADRTIKNQQLGVEFPPNDSNEGFNLEDLQRDDLIEDERAILVTKKNKKENNSLDRNNLQSLVINDVKKVFELIIQEGEFLIEMQTIDKYGKLSQDERFPYYVESLCKALQIKNEQELNQLINLFIKKSQENEVNVDDNQSLKDSHESVSNLNIDPDRVLDYLKEFYEERKKVSKEQNGKNNNYSQNDTSDAFKERMIYLSEKVWNEKLGKIISDKTYSVWKSLYSGLTKYHDLLFERKKVINETNDLYEKNKELKNLLKAYMNKEDNQALRVPPHQTIKIEKINFALSELGSGYKQ